jgi:hypothetical protein
MVNWQAHRHTYTRLTKFQQLSVTKLIHNLANTNRQNYLFYGTSNLCPGCQLEEQTFEHVIRCSLPATVQFRDEQLEVLSSNLKRIHTPEQIVITIMHGFWVWLTPLSSTSRAPTAGSLKGQDILLTTAYHEQLHSIGWYQLSLGRVSKYWSATFKYYRDQGSVHMDPEYWTSLFINYQCSAVFRKKK